MADLSLDEKAALIWFGVYDCMACGKEYLVNDKWAPCSWVLCHDCYGKDWHVPNPYPDVTYSFSTREERE